MERAILEAVARADLILRWGWGAILGLIAICAVVMILSCRRWDK